MHKNEMRINDITENKVPDHDAAEHCECRPVSKTLVVRSRDAPISILHL